MSNTVSLLQLLLDRQFHGFPAIELLQLITAEECEHEWSTPLHTFYSKACVTVFDGAVLAQCDIRCSDSDGNSIPETIYISLSGLGKTRGEEMDTLVHDYQKGCIDATTCCNRLVDTLTRR